MGLLNGNQTQLGYLSPKTTDFIYSVIGEEMGFIISAAVILVYVTLITKSLYVAKTASDDLGTYIAAGISRNIFIPHGRKYRYDIRLTSYNRSSIVIYKLWWKFNDNKLYVYRITS